MTIWDVLVALGVVAALVVGGSYLYYEFRVRRPGRAPMPPPTPPPETPDSEPPPPSARKPPRTPR